MYKNFNLTDEERKEIMEMHKSHGYKKPLNETADNSLDVNEGEMSIVKKTINAILKKNGIKKVESHSTSVKGFRRYSGSGYEHNYGGSLSLYNMPEDTVKDIADQMKAAGVKVVTVYNNGFSYDPRELNTSDESINELDDKDIDLIRGKSTQKWSRAGKQFQQDFENDFADPAEEPVPFWEKDKPRPSDDSEIETDIRTNARQANRELGKKSEKDTIFQDREERIKLSRRIASLVSHREEFGGDDELDNLIRRLRAQAMDMDDSRQPSVTSDETSNLNEGVSRIKVKLNENKRFKREYFINFHTKDNRFHSIGPYNEDDKQYTGNKIYDIFNGGIFKRKTENYPIQIDDIDGKVRWSCEYYMDGVQLEKVPSSLGSGSDLFNPETEEYYNMFGQSIRSHDEDWNPEDYGEKW